MTKNDDDSFKPKLGRISSRGNAKAKSYINRVLHQISAAGETGFGTARSRRFTGARIGRGNEVLRRYRASSRFGPTSRRVVIKSRIVKLAGRAGGDGLAAARAHIRYIQRDVVSKDHDPGQLYDANGENCDGGAFLERCQSDRHQFRFIVSPEDATEMSDLKPFVCDLMATIEDDLGTKLDWVAVDHFNTGHPHTHIVLRGKDDQGKDLIIARDYIAHGMRRRASELLTLELGPQTEREIRHKLERQVEQDRFTDLDRRLVRQAGGELLDMEAGPDRTDARFRHAMQIARLQVLELRGLAEETAPGRWRLSPDLEKTLRRAGERGDIIKTMHRGLQAAGLDAGVTEYSIFDPGDPRTRAILGQIIDRGLHDELKDGHYVMIDAADGRVHYVALDPDHDMEDVPKGAIVEVHPARLDLRPSDRTIKEVADANDGLYSPDLHRGHDPKASPVFVQAHIRRLEALRRTNVVRRFPDGGWEIPPDFEERVSKLANRRMRYPGKVETLSYLSLEDQIGANGATWLDRQLLSKGPISFRGNNFGKVARQALESRRDHLFEEGLAKRDGDFVRYQRSLLRLLRQREISETGNRLAIERNLEFVTLQDGERMDGVYRQPLRLASGKFAMIEKAKGFTLVPWRPVLERYRGKAIGATTRGSSVSFEFGKKRGIGTG